MLKWFGGVRFRRLVVVIPLLISIVIPLYPALTNRSGAAAFSIKTGYYLGTGATKSITGLGFQPQFILIKQTISTTAAGLIKTKDMSASTIASTGSAANSAGVTIDSNGFTLSSTASANVSGDYVTYVAIAGSDCTSSGSVCVGTYNGDGTGIKTITTGFQPSLVIAKSNQAVGAHFKTASMPSANTEFITSTAANTASAYIGGLSSTGFSVGATDNLSGSTYYYVAFKASPSYMSEGTYTGTGLDDRNLSVTSYRPSMVMVKNSSSASTGNRRSIWSTTEHQGDFGSYIGDTPSSTQNSIQALQPTGFQVGTMPNVNENGTTLYWFALGGGSGPSSTGTFKMATGTYSGTGVAQSVTGLAFQPDVLQIKDNSTNVSVFRTSMMPGDLTFSNATSASDITGGITSLDSGGFTLGTNVAVNSSGSTYQWQAFGNAYNPNTNSGSSDFAVGAINGNNTDNRDIGGLPFQPDLVTARKVASGTSYFRTSAHSGDATSTIGGSTDAANIIQSFSSDGFQLGNPPSLNVLANVTYWFAFKQGTNLVVGSYSGNAVVDRPITSPGFQSDLIWIKGAGSTAMIQKPSTLAGDNSQYFTATGNASGKIKSITSTGFTLGTGAEVNSNAVSYRYVAWKIPPSGSLSVGVVDSGGSAVSSPAFSLSSIGFPFDCTSSTGTIGASSQRIRVTNTTGSPAWSLSIAATGGTTALWGNGGNTLQYDFNDTTTSGCADGADGDSKAGKMSIDASAGTLNPQSGCSNTNVSKGSSSDFNEGTTNSITLLSASASAGTNCYWELTGVGIGQTIPAQQASDSYNINMTVTITAS